MRLGNRDGHARNFILYLAPVFLNTNVTQLINLQLVGSNLIPKPLLPSRLWWKRVGDQISSNHIPRSLLFGLGMRPGYRCLKQQFVLIGALTTRATMVPSTEHHL